MFRVRRKRLKKLTSEEKYYECRMNNHDVWSEEYWERWAVGISCKTCHPIINSILDLPAIVITVPIGIIFGVWLIMWAGWPWPLGCIFGAFLSGIITPKG